MWLCPIIGDKSSTPFPFLTARASMCVSSHSAYSVYHENEKQTQLDFWVSRPGPDVSPESQLHFRCGPHGTSEEELVWLSEGLSRLLGDVKGCRSPLRRRKHRPAAGEARGARQSETRPFPWITQNRLTQHRDEPKGKEWKWGFQSPILGWSGLYLPKAGSSQASVSLRRPVFEFEKEMLNLWTPAAQMDNIRWRDTFQWLQTPRPQVLGCWQMWNYSGQRHLHPGPQKNLTNTCPGGKKHKIKDKLGTKNKV